MFRFEQNVKGHAYKINVVQCNVLCNVICSLYCPFSRISRIVKLLPIYKNFVKKPRPNLITRIIVLNRLS